ncbi:MAG: hypothetical protein WA821_11210 [Anaerolineales bacterium]
MKRAFRYAIVLTLVLPVLLACNMSAAQPTPIRLIPHTDTPAPLPGDTDTPGPVAVATGAPESTSTLGPVSTPVALPDELNNIFSGVSVEYQDNFDGAADALPSGWICSEPSAAWVTSDNQFEIKSASQVNGTGMTVYFSRAQITPNTGVYFTFQYSGVVQNFTLGVNAVGSNGQIAAKGQKDFYSVTLEMSDKVLTAHTVQKTVSTKGPFRGDLKLQEGAWYNIALGLDGDKNFIIKLWSPTDPRKQLFYTYKSKEFPTTYYFIGWVSAKRSLLIDNFTIFKFDEILEK